MDFHCVALQLQVPKGESVEAAARQARYAVFRDFLQPEDALLLAHHQDDQVETLVLQLLRGAGPHGLAAMGDAVPFQAGRMIRPLLDVTRTQIELYAREKQLHWIEDPSNASDAFDRNYLRRQVMPLLEKRWPSYRKTIARAACHQQETAKLLDEVAALDWQQSASTEKNQLSMDWLTSLSLTQQQNLLRYWIRFNGFITPNQKQLMQILSMTRLIGEDHQPIVAWDAVEVRGYQRRLYLLPVCELSAPQTILWKDRQKPLKTGIATHHLLLRACVGAGIAQHWLEASDHQVEVGYRAGGERCRFAGKSFSTSVKKYFQQQKIPPWERERIPLLWIDGKLAAIVGHEYCEFFVAKEQEPGYELVLDSCIRENEE